jgi:uncharacterized membrane protein YeaQ/YmgE (transglycosylase-associated protein family)
MLVLGFLGWIIIGGLTGRAAAEVRKTGDRKGLLRNVALGVAGGLIGGFLLGLVGVDLHGGRLLLSFLTCLAGAILMIWSAEKVTGHRV